MNCIYIYYEKPSVCPRYFKSSISLLKRLFGFDKIIMEPVDNISELTLPSHFPYPRILLTHGMVNFENSLVNFDGIGFSNHNIALVRYQSMFFDTIYLLAHEIGHLFGMAHCDSPNCLMGVYREGAQTRYSWCSLSKRRKISSRLFCDSCKSLLYSRPITTEVGG
ncbi:MAG: hypothetical protein KAT37_02270 [Candidatus Aenigmarchaeota archaeon]|nr:hypothetical protein [Candidatus Aenigmarchaeota archaeon]